jgi:hypothetical protein
MCGIVHKRCHVLREIALEKLGKTKNIKDPKISHHSQITPQKSFGTNPMKNLFHG